MKETKTLTHDEIVRYNRLADRMVQGVRPRLEFLRQRTQELAGLTADPALFAGITNEYAAALSDPSAETDAAQRTALEVSRATGMFEYCELIDRMRNKEPEAIHELNELWIEQIDLFLRAKTNFLMFFRTVSLAPDQQVCYEHTYRNEVDVKYVGQDGGIRTRKAVKAKKQTFFDMKELHTEGVEYALRDINTGMDVAAIAQATVDIAWEMEAKLNKLAKDLFVTLIGSFTTSGAKLDRTYIPNQYIDTSNLPTTNALECDDVANSPTTLFRADAVRKIMKYCQRWADVWGAPIQPTGVILVPSLDATDLSQEFTPTGSANNPTAERIVAGNYLRFEWFDKLWTLVPDVTLAPGTCFPVLTQPVGDYFTKPAFDEVFTETFKRKNKEERSMMKVIQLTSPQPRRVNALRVVYRTSS